jgi:MscS family membrane protein
MTLRGAAAIALLLASTAGSRASAQIVPPSATAANAAAQTAATPSAPPVDTLARTTPRATVLSFLNAARNDDYELARQYLDTRLAGEEGRQLAHELFVVLDARLPAKLTLISDAPGGSRANPLEPDSEIVGTIDGPDGPVAIALERISRPKVGQIWLFSRDTLDSLGPLYEDVTNRDARVWLPGFLFEWHVGHVRLFEWGAVLLGLGLLYAATGVINFVLTAVVTITRRAAGREPRSRTGGVLPFPVRLLLMALAGRWLVATLPVSLMVREFLSVIVSLVAIVTVAWLVILVNGVIERAVCRRIPPANVAAGVSLVRVGRRLLDVLVIFAAVLATLRRFGVNPTPVLAGLGVGGIAIALAAQKTLENVIAGASLIFDQALRVGDALKLGDVQGTVDHIGLRSTRIRTLDRTIVTVPNGQVANMSLEILSARDRFRFQPVVGLRYETTPDQLREILTGIRALLAAYPAVQDESIRVRFIRLGAFSLDVEVFAYVFARDWANFLEMQEQLLLQILAVVSTAGASIAFPSQTMYVERAPIAETA